MNVFDQMRSAVSEAESTLLAADMVSDRIAKILVGRLRHCNWQQLDALKRELKNYNARTGEWKD